MKIGPSGLGLFLYTLAACAQPVRAAAQAAPSAGAKAEGWIVVAAGDISCDPRSAQYKEGHGTARHCHALATSNLVVSLRPAAVLVLGDSQYDRGAPDAYRKAWANNWGRSELKDITHPSAGNHEYNTPDASGYFDWFGPQAGEKGKGYYSFDLGTWHLVALNTGGNDRCRPLSCGQDSEQEKWLRKDLAKNNLSCTLAFWHRPLFTSGLHSGAVEVTPFWRDLYEAHADLVLNGHSHQYERFSPQDPGGASDPDRGITQFVVGTGGKNLKDFWHKRANSVVRNSKAYGVLKLELLPASYAWEFISESGQVLDSGTGQCHSRVQR